MVPAGSVVPIDSETTPSVRHIYEDFDVAPLEEGAPPPPDRPALTIIDDPVRRSDDVVDALTGAIARATGIPENLLEGIERTFTNEAHGISMENGVSWENRSPDQILGDIQDIQNVLRGDLPGAQVDISGQAHLAVHSSLDSADFLATCGDTSRANDSFIDWRTDAPQRATRVLSVYVKNLLEDRPERVVGSRRWDVHSPESDLDVLFRSTGDSRLSNAFEVLEDPIVDCLDRVVRITPSIKVRYKGEVVPTINLIRTPDFEAWKYAAEWMDKVPKDTISDKADRIRIFEQLKAHYATIR